MKRKLFAVGIATFATVAIAGSGFAAWFFNEDPTTNKDASITAHITDAAKRTGLFEETFSTNTYRIVLDQGGYSKKDNLDYGISVESKTTDSQDPFKTVTSASEFDVTYEPTEGYPALWEQANIKVNFVATVTLNDKLAEYVTFTSAFKQGVVGNVYTSKKEITNGLEEDDIVSQTIGFDLRTVDGANKMFKYVKKPKTFEEHSNMVTAITQDLVDAVKITYSVEFLDGSNKDTPIAAPELK